MAGSGTAQQRLDQLVRLIADEMVAEVCSVYVMRAGDVLELFATQGLNQEAVHVTRLRLGEGLVGTVAATADPLNLPDAQSHPNFSYRPETGEEIYSSLLGVPVIRGGRVRGVLVIQNRAKRTYTEEEEEALELISVVIAELIASGDLIDPDERRRQVAGRSFRPMRLSGQSINEGLAIGEAVLHQPNISIQRMFTDDPEAEHARLREAMQSMHTALDLMLASTRLRAAGEHREVLDTYRQFAEDRGWLRRIREGIDGGLTADAAVQKVREDTIARMQAITDPYLRDRLNDLEDIANRLMQHLSGGASRPAVGRLPDAMILLARNLGPAELLDYDTSKIRALVTEQGAATSHVSIIARALGIPVVSKIEGLMKNVDPGDPVIVDGDNGQIFVRPSEDIQSMVTDTLRAREQRRSLYASMRSLRTVTRNGDPVSLNINCGMLADMQWLSETGADGIGLFRTEIPFMVRSAFPDVEQQTRIYRQVLNQAEGKPVQFRTLDIGGDKQLPYFQDSEEQNPALGWRSIRVGLDRPAMLRQQLRALIRAAEGRELDLMFPMIAEVAEFNAARRILDLELEHQKAEGIELPAKIRLGTMLEVPGLIWQLDTLFPLIDFLSIGSNDLFQFLFAFDRGNPRVASRYDVLSPSMLSMLRDVIARCRAADVRVSLCGEMAGRPIEAMALLGIGLTSLSMAPSMYGSIKAMTLSVDTVALGAYLDTLLRGEDHSLRRKLLAFAHDHNVVLET
jgi:phosphotransferase system enzyme I (PtsP)